MELSEDYEAKLRNVFDVCDVDKRGLISVDNLVDLARQHLTSCDRQTSEEAIARILKVLDSEGNGSINFVEFCEGVKRILELQGSVGGSVSSEERGVGQLDEGTGGRLGGRGGESHGEDDSNSCEAFESSEVSTYNEYDVTDDYRVHSDDLSSLSAETTRQSSCAGATRTSSEDDGDSGFHGKTSRDHRQHNGHWLRGHSGEEEQTFEYYGGDQHDGGGGSANSGSLFSPLRTLTPTSGSDRKVPRSVSPRLANTRITPSAIASHLYGGGMSSLNTSRRSSVSDGLYEDIDGNFTELNDKVKTLESRIQELTDTQHRSNERNMRMKEENSTLIERVHQLEEQIREMDSRAQERSTEDKKKHKELLARTDKEKSIEIDMLTQSLKHIETDYFHLREEAPVLKSENDRLRRENAQLEREVSRLQRELDELTEERTSWQQHSRDEQMRVVQERRVHAQLIDELSKELEELRALRADTLRRSSSKAADLPRSVRREMESHIDVLKEANAKLREQCEDLHAQLISKHVDEGLSLLREKQSLAAEFESLPRDELMVAVKKEQEANQKLREYVEQITLRILEKNPSILEVKSRSSF